MEMATTEGSLSIDHFNEYRQSLSADSTFRLAMNAVTRTEFPEIAINRDVVNALDFTFSNEIETGPITDQKRGSTCWLFADLNWIRTFTKKKLNTKNFEYSQNYILFWDKVEKANYFLEKMIELRDQPLDDRKIQWLFEHPVPEGGEWHMMANLVRKYGIVPRSAMNYTFSVENTRFLNERLTYKLRESAAQMRQAIRSGATVEELRGMKAEIMEKIYRIVAVFLGLPPVTFNWSYRDEEKKFHRDVQITPLEFAEKYMGLDMNDVYCLMSCPGEDTPFGRTFTVEFFNNMVDGKNWHWLNVPIDVLKRHTLEMAKAGEAVLFGCDVIQQGHSKEGILDTRLYDYEGIFGVSFHMDKATRVQFGQTRLTHSMVINGVDLVDDKPIKWKIENSWGDAVGKKGYFVMSDEWFDEHVFDLLVPKKYLSEELLPQFEQTPIVLPPWHPMA